MAIRNIRRQATNPGAYPATPTAAPIYVDSDDNKLKMIPAGSGTTEVEIVDASSTQTLSNKTIADSLGVNRAIFNGTVKTILDASATSLFDYAVPSGAGSGGVCFYQVFAADGTDEQSMAGMISYSAVNKAGTVTASAIGYATGNDSKSVSAGTITLAWTNVAGTLKATVKLQPTGSLTETTFWVAYTVFPISGAITIL